MATVKLGALAQDVRGSLAGTVFSRNKGGSYVRQKVSPIQPSTDRQLAQRGILSRVTKAWSALSLSVRNAWLTWADNHPVTNVFGDSIKLGGTAAFAKVQAFLLTCNLPMLSDVPAAPTIAPAGVVSIGATASTGNLVVTLSSGTYTGLNVTCYAWPTTTDSQTQVKSKLRYAGTQDGSAGGAVTFTPATVNPKLKIIAGEVYHVLIVQHDDQANVLASSLLTTVCL